MVEYEVPYSDILLCHFTRIEMGGFIVSKHTGTRRDKTIDILLGTTAKVSS
jgi:hypothetical protein